ncbi:hypoxanthine phosphoribosyltransferase [Peptoniphilus sp. KCTC 25270]|uniref:hypoxanthine phosphoribosyltransferase n=1 Tax=Peptoniphilus sp. KCTC 25270 TaxID=2897414 RepID=UPI001E40DC42|nr:hypoxanthine phosphoribosyltransferase [Peptoniphilus sp. KCTC 25270]MCD1147998.1 hypoxanthine phosphoribosyltransferase [Peptoniphilus sp. KCTC 25270]
MAEKRERVLYDRETISQRVRELGKELQKEYEGKDLLVIALLRGSFVFAADLVREIDTIMEVDFLTTSSYEDSEVSSGQVQILDGLRAPIEGRHVLLVDDIVDSGRTLKAVSEYVASKNPASLHSVVMLDKPSRREVEFKADYVAFTIEDVFIVGCGLNYGPHYRNVPYIFTYEDDEE